MIITRALLQRKPITVISRSVEIISFLVVGIFVLTILTSVFLSLKQEKVNENVRLATQLCEQQNKLVSEYAIKHYGKDVKTAMKEIKSIDESLKKLKELINGLF